MRSHAVLSGVGTIGCFGARCAWICDGSEGVTWEPEELLVNKLLGGA